MTAAVPHAGRLARLGTEAAFAVSARAKALAATGRDVLDLAIGEPGVPTPSHIVEAGARALADGHTGYAPPQGLAALRNAIAADARARGIPADPDRVVVTPGAKPALFHAALALLEDGDEALVPDPGFPIYPSIVRAAGATPVPYRLHPDAIAEAVTARTRVLFLNTPNNPTGAVWSAAELERLAETVLRHDLVIVSDEIYSRIRFAGQHASPAHVPEVCDRTLVIDGASKAWAMTGWRLGWTIAPAPLVEPLTRLVINTVSCTAPFVQLAGVAALTGPDTVRRFVAGLRRRRDAFVAGLNTLPGVSCPPPAGAFYAFPHIAGADAAFVRRLLEDDAVAALDGAGFGARGAGHVRFSFTAPPDHLARALNRLRARLTTREAA